MKRYLIKTISMAALATTLVSVNPGLANAAWKQNSTGWWYTEGNSWATGWRQINGTWYYFDSNGYMKTGWVQDGPTWYYMDNSGAMQTGWVQVGHDWYYLNSSGAMQTGWIDYKSNKYYLNNSGAMVHLDIIDGYFIDSDGIRGNKVSVNSWQEAEKLIAAADSNFIKKLTDKDSTIGFKNPSFNESKYVVGLNDYNIEEEPVFSLVLSSGNTDSFDYYAYFVGAYSGKVYSGNNQGGCNLYEIKNNKIEKSYASKSNPNSPNWR